MIPTYVKFQDGCKCPSCNNRYPSDMEVSTMDPKGAPSGSPVPPFFLVCGKCESLQIVMEDNHICIFTEESLINCIKKSDLFRAILLKSAKSRVVQKILIKHAELFIQSRESDNL